jgi:hypothetical protein
MRKSSDREHGKQQTREPPRPLSETTFVTLFEPVEAKNSLVKGRTQQKSEEKS